MFLRKIPEPRAGLRAAVVLALLSSRDLWAAESGVEAYQIDSG